MQITAYFRAAGGTGDTGTARSVAEEILGTYPTLFLLVGLVVLFLRVEDRNAWLLALLFASFIAMADLPSALSLDLKNWFWPMRWAIPHHSESRKRWERFL